MSDYKTSAKSSKDIRNAADNLLKEAGYDCLNSVGKIITVYLSQEVNIDVYDKLASSILIDIFDVDGTQ